MVFLTHQNPLARPSDHRSTPSCLRSALQLAAISRRILQSTMLVLPTHAACRFGVLSSLALHITMLGEECAEKVACSTLPARTWLHNPRQMHISATPGGCNYLCRHRYSVSHLRFRQLSP